MSYNFKVFNLGNGEIQVCSYPNLVKSSEVNSNDYDEEIVNKLTQSLKKRNKPCSINITSWSLLTDDLKDSYNRLRSFQRSKDSVYKLALCNEWDYFCTFTFDSANFRYDYDICIKRFRKFMNNFKNRYCDDLLYLFIVEPHKDGAYHLHGLIKSKKIKDYLFHKIGERSFAFFLKNYNFGLSDLEIVEDPARISNYITKYIGKEMFSRFGCNRYFCSRGLKHPEVDTYLVDQDFMKFIDDNFSDYDIKHIYAGRNKTTYLSLKLKKDS